MRRQETTTGKDLVMIIDQIYHVMYKDGEADPISNSMPLLAVVDVVRPRHSLRQRQQTALLPPVLTLTQPIVYLSY